MADNTLNITVETDDAQLQSLKETLNNTNLTVGQLSKTFREYSSTVIAGSQAQKDLMDIKAQALSQMKSEQAQENSLTNVIRGARQERRMYMFAVNESMAAVTAIIGKEDALTKSVAQGAQAFFGMQFALQALGGTFAEFAMPVAAIIALFIVIKQLFFDTAEQAKESAEAQKKYNDAYAEWHGLVVETQGLKEKAGEGDYATEQKKLDRLRNTLQDAKADYDAYVAEGRAAETEGLKAEKAYLEAKQAVHDQEVEISSQRKKDSADEEKKREKELNDLATRQDAMHQIGLMNDQEYLAVLKTREQRALIGDDLKEQAALMKEITDLQVKIAQNPDLQPLDTSLKRLGRVSVSTTVKGVPVGQASAKDNSEAITGYIVDPLREGFRTLAQQTNEWFYNAFDRSIGTNSVLEKMLVSTLGAVLNTFTKDATDYLANIAITGITTLLGLASGGDVSFGGPLQFAANGGNYGYGRTQNVIVGERGPELMQVGTNGVRVVPNHMLGGSGGGMSTSVQIGDLKLAGTDLVASYTLTQQARRGRRF